MARNERSSEDEYRFWWEKTFGEREIVLRERFGETVPPGYVTAFSWDDPELMIPGACSLSFSPRGERNQWLYLSHGLTQPLEPEPPISGRWSGYGCEFAMLTKEKNDWASQVLYQLLSYWKASGATIGIGHRIPMAFFDSSDGLIRPEMGIVEGDMNRSVIGLMRALIFWPYLVQPKPLWSSTGYFDILVGTTITMEEWEMAKQSTSTHLLYLLVRSGVGQVSDLSRSTVTDDPRWSEEWNEIRQLAESEIEEMLIRGH